SSWRMWLTLVFGPRTVVLTFSARELLYRPGMTSDLVDGSVGPFKRWVVRRGQVAGSLRLERVGERQRLSVDCGADGVEIGTTLNEGERDWLYRLLREWAGGEDRFFSPERGITSREPVP